jgi:hypothetical protein
MLENWLGSVSDAAPGPVAADPLTGVPMSVPFATPGWAQAVKAALGRSLSFKEQARNWRVALLLTVSGGPSPAHIFFDLRYGEVVDVIALTDPGQRAPDVVVAGPYSAWRAVFRKEQGFLQALMTTTLEVTHGPSVRLMGAPKAVNEFVNVVATVDTTWEE